jgi:hypothetical protein
MTNIHVSVRSFIDRAELAAARPHKVLNVLSKRSLANAEL